MTRSRMMGEGGRLAVGQWCGGWCGGQCGGECGGWCGGWCRRVELGVMLMVVRRVMRRCGGSCGGWCDTHIHPVHRITPSQPPTHSPTRRPSSRTFTSFWDIEANVNRVCERGTQQRGQSAAGEACGGQRHHEQGPNLVGHCDRLRALSSGGWMAGGGGWGGRCLLLEC